MTLLEPIARRGRARAAEPAASHKARARDDANAAPRRVRRSTQETSHGIILFGLLVGAAAGLVITDTSANRDFRIAAGLPVAARPVIAGSPARIADGDTFRISDVRIRLHGVDAPEMSTPDGQPARAHLAALVAASPGPLRCEDTGDRTYDRVVAQCFTADGRDLSVSGVLTPPSRGRSDR